MRNAKKSGKVIEMEGSAKQEPVLEDSNGREIMRQRLRNIQSSLQSEFPKPKPSAKQQLDNGSIHQQDSVQSEQSLLESADLVLDNLNVAPPVTYVKQQAQRQDQFQHPPPHFLNLTFNSLQQIVQWLTQYQLSSNFPSKRRKIWNVNKPSLTLKCKYCPSILTFRLSPDNATILCTKFSNRHSHTTNTNESREKMIEALKVIDEIRPMYTQYEMFFLIQEKYNFTKKETRNVFRIDWMRNPLKYTMEKLWVRDFDFRHYQGDESITEMPEILVFLSENMLTFNRKWGDVIGLQFLYDVLPAKPGKHSTLSLGIFTGVAPTLQPIILGACLLTKSSRNNYIRLLRFYLQMTGGYPLTMITQDIKQIAEAIQELRSTNELPGNHLIDTNCVLRRISNSSPEGYPEPLELYERLMDSENQVQFQKNLNLLRDRCVSEELFQNFLLEASKTSFSQASPIFIGFNMKMAKCPILRFLKNQGTFKDMASLLDALTMVQRQCMIKLQLGLTNPKQYQSIFHQPRLKQIRQKLSSPVFCKFLSKYSNGLKCSMTNQITHYQVIDIDEEMFKVALDSDGRLRCHCDYQTKTGIPCEHLMCVFAKNSEIEWMPYIHRRWIHDANFSRVMARDARLMRLMSAELS